MGSLRKYSTALKKNLEVRRKFNQTYFEAGTPLNSTFKLSTHELGNIEGKVKKKRRIPKRRLTEENRQMLITSIFSPRNGNRLASVSGAGSEETSTTNEGVTVEEDEKDLE